jgi:hypothetical protein
MRFSIEVARAITAGVTIVATPALLPSQILVPPDRTTTIGVMSNGPAPTSVNVTGTPTVATVTWQPVSGAVRYTVMRAKDGDPMCCNAQSGDITATSWTDNGSGSGIQWSGTYVYTVVAWQSTGVYGQTIVKWLRPEPMNPTGFSAKQTGEGTAVLSWVPATGASYSWIWGPGTGTEGVRADGASKTFTGIGAGAKEWSITTRYDPSGFLLPSSTWPKTQLNMVSMTGNYRITLNGFEVLQNAADDNFNADGVGGELFALAYVRQYDRNSGGILAQGAVESSVHGDTEGFAGRVPAGTAKSTGGLLNGDKYPSATPWVRPTNSVSSTTFPLLVWEGALTEGRDVLVITPMLWEWDGTRDRNDRFRLEGAKQDMNSTAGAAWQIVAPALASSGSWTGPGQVVLNWKDEQFAMTDNSEGDQYARHHPVGGSVPSSQYKKHWIAPQVGLVFTRELIEKALNSTTQVGGYGPGVIPVKWEDNSRGGAGKGSYVLYLQFARQ